MVKICPDETFRLVKNLLKYKDKSLFKLQKIEVHLQIWNVFAFHFSYYIELIYFFVLLT